MMFKKFVALGLASVGLFFGSVADAAYVPNVKPGYVLGLPSTASLEGPPFGYTIPQILGYTPLSSSQNLSDLANTATARTNLGLGSAATISAPPACVNALTWSGSAWGCNNAVGGGGISGPGTSAVGSVVLWNSTTGAAIKDGGFVPLNPSNNLSEIANASTARTNLGLGALATLNSVGSSQIAGGAVASNLGFIPLNPSNNLSDVSNTASARTNLGLGSISTYSSVASALGYTPINKAGDTMTGSLTVSSSGGNVGLTASAPSGKEADVTLVYNGVTQGNLFSNSGTPFGIYDPVNNGVSFRVSSAGNTTIGESGKTTTVNGLTSGSITGGLGYTPANAGNFISMKDWLPAGQPDGSTENSTGFTNAVSALCGFTPAGGRIFMPSGHYMSHDIAAACPISWSGSGPQNTIWDYSGVSNSAIKYQPTNWPNVTQASRIYGPSIRDIRFFDGNSGDWSNGNYAIVLKGVDQADVTNVQLGGYVDNGIYVYGSYRVVIATVNYDYYADGIGGINGNGITLFGDASGKSRTGGACSGGDCSTWTNVVTITNYTEIGNTNGTGILINGSVDTVAGEHISIENKNIGFQTACPGGYPDASSCPQFITLTDAQAEGSVYEAFQLYDFTDFQCFGCYAIANGSGSNHGVDAQMVNYGQLNGAGGGLRWFGGRAGNSGGSAMWLFVSDVVVEGTWLVDGNLSNIGANGIDFGAANGKFSDNTFCKLLGYTPGQTMGGINFDSGASDTTVKGNSFRGCTSSVTGSPGGTNYNVQNTGP